MLNTETEKAMEQAEKRIEKKQDNHIRKSFFKGFSLVKLNILLWGVIVVVAIVAIIKFCNSTKQDKVAIVVDDKIDITPTLVTSMKEIGEWEFLSVTDEEIIDTIRKGFLRDDKLVRIYYGKMSLGINMRKAEPHWVEQKDDSIIVKLPAIELLDNDFIDEARTRAFIETGSWTDSDREALYRKAYSKMKKRCLTSQNLNTAKDNATTQFGKMLKAMGIDKYKIEFQK